MDFANRAVAAQQLVERLEDLRGANPLILAIPRGGVPMGRIIADSLAGDLDVVLVHKFGIAEQPEFALGSVTEDGAVLLGKGAEAYGANEKDVETAIMREIHQLQERRKMYTPYRPAIDPIGRIVVIVDDGIATGATMAAAIHSLREKHAARIIVAAPVASQEAVHRLEGEGAEVRVLKVPELFFSVSQFYDDFSQVNDEDVIMALSGGNCEVMIEAQPAHLRGFLSVPKHAEGLIIFAHGSGSGRHSLRNQFVANVFERARFATLLVDFLEDEETSDRNNEFDIGLLSRRLALVTEWAGRDPRVRDLPIGYFGASSGAAVAMRAAVLLGDRVSAIVSRGGQLELAEDCITRLRAPTLLLVGGEDPLSMDPNHRAFERMECEKDLVVVPNASHLFSEPGTLEDVAQISTEWFERHLGKRPRARPVIGQGAQAERSPSP